MTRTWDVFCLNDELDILELRLRMYDRIVDRFVVTEGTHTFSGMPKPLHFADSGDRFAPWADKIVHVVAELTPSPVSAWDNETAQRAQMIRPLEEADPDDLVILADVDEFSSRRLLEEMVETLTEPTLIRQRHAIYFANTLLPEPFGHTIAFRAEQLPAVLGLFGTDRWDIQVVDDAGIHLSFLGGSGAVAKKIAAYSHQEFNTPRDLLDAHLRRCVDNHVHFSGTAALRLSPSSEWTSEQREVHQLAPGLFWSASPVPPWRSWTYCAITWLRRRRRTPPVVLAALDKWPRGAMVLGAPVLIPLFGAIRLLERRRGGLWPIPTRWVR